MDRGEPTFVPEWYKGASGSGASGGASSSHHTKSSSHSDERGIGLLSRNRLSVSVCDHDTPRSSAFSDRSSSSFRRSTSSNGSMSHDKSSAAHSRPYSSFGRSQRERDREKDPDLRYRDRSLLLDNGFCDHADSFKSSKTEKDNLRRSNSILTGRPVESSSRRPGKDLNNGVHSVGSTITGISKASFERDFPSLGAEEKLSLLDGSRISSTGPSTAMQSLPVGALAIAGGEAWTSALVIPVKVGGNGPVLSSALQIAPASSSSVTFSTTTGLNMAETLIHAPSRVCNAPQLSVDTQRREELTRIQYSKLIPVTPSMPKCSVLNSSDKSKSKVAKAGDLSAPLKVGLQSSSQIVTQPLRAPARSDVPMTSQAGNFQVLNRERNGVSPTAKDAANLLIAGRAVTLLGGVPSCVVPPPRKADGKGGALISNRSTFVEKKPFCQAQNRNEFFNAIRKKTSANNSTVVPEPGCIASSPTSDKSEKEDSVPGSGLECFVEDGNDMFDDSGACQEPESFIPDDSVDKSSLCAESVVVDPDEEEAAFLRSLGWEENTGEEALTAEEIESFVKEHGKLRPSSKLCHRELQSLKAVAMPDEAGSSSALSSSDSEAEA